MYYNSKRAVTMPSNDAIADVSVVNPVVDDSVPVASDNLDVSSNLDTADNANSDVINDIENNSGNAESGEAVTDMSSTDTNLNVPEGDTNSLISTMPIAGGNMGVDDSMMGGDTQDGGKGLSNTAILSIVIGACVVVGIVLGIIFGKKAANK